MRTLYFLAIFFCTLAEATEVYVPPEASQSVLAGVDFAGEAVGQKFRSRFSECDNKNMCDGKALKYGCSNDPNRNSALLKLKGATIFFDGKMGLDADGSPYSQNTPGRTDQPQTSLRYPQKRRPSVNADRVPYIVVPQGGFENELGVQIGDVAAVIYGGSKIYAVVADQGPTCKVGEGSIQLHELLGHAVCKTRSSNGDCVKLRNAGIEKEVLYFIFPGTHNQLMPGLNPENMGARIESIGNKAWEQLTTP